jgi:hypothetical protein
VSARSKTRAQRAQCLSSGQGRTSSTFQYAAVGVHLAPGDEVLDAGIRATAMGLGEVDQARDRARYRRCDELLACSCLAGASRADVKGLVAVRAVARNREPVVGLVLRETESFSSVVAGLPVGS